MKDTSLVKIFIIVIAARVFTDLVGFVGSSYIKKYHPGNGFIIDNHKTCEDVKNKP
jgi:hypothetical protein